jgi:hypothetical protein
MAWALWLVALFALSGCSKNTYVSDVGGFAVDCPIGGTPEDRSRVQDGIQLYSWELHDAGGRFYRVGYTDLAGAEALSATAIYDGKRQDLERAHGTIDREADAYVGNLLGRDYFWHTDASGTNVSCWTRVFLKGSRLYQAAFYGPKAAIDTVAIDTAKQFMGSFRFQ